MSAMSDIQDLVESFAAELTVAIEAAALAQARAAVFAAIGGSPAIVKRRGRPPKALSAETARVTAAPKDQTKDQTKDQKAAQKKARKKAPLQLCPVPYCRNPAAPVFGMVCAKHKNVPKAKIKKYREARKAKKAGVNVVARKARRTPKPGPKKTLNKTPKKTLKKTLKKTTPPRTVEAPAAAPPASVAAG